MATGFFSIRTGWYAMLGVSGGFIGYYLASLLFLAAAVPSHAGWAPLYAMFGSEPNTLLVFSMPVLFTLSARTISRHHQVDRWYLMMSALIGAIHQALLMFWPFLWWL